MHDALVALPAGALLGFFFFGGLWWTTRRATLGARPGFTVLASMVLRMGLTLAGFYLLADGRWERLLAALSGFMLARFVTLRLLRPVTEARHAP
jgi:F1F0 ATPase subunit 2